MTFLPLKFRSFLTFFSDTFTARMIASIFFLLFCLIMHNFSFDHHGKVTLQMQNFLIEQNTIRIPQPPNSFYYSSGVVENIVGGQSAAGDFDEFDDDGDEDYERYNDEDYYI